MPGGSDENVGAGCELVRVGVGLAEDVRGWVGDADVEGAAVVLVLAVAVAGAIATAVLEVLGGLLVWPEPELPDVHPAIATGITARKQTSRGERTFSASHIDRRVRRHSG